MHDPTNEQISQWAEKLSRSDEKAFDALFRALYPRLTAFACSFTRNRAVAADVVQDVFLTVWDRRHQVDPERSVRAWLYQMVRNRALNQIRDYQSRVTELDTERSNGIMNDQSEFDDPDLSDSGAEAELRRKLAEWIGELPSRQREAFELSRFEGLDHEEISEVMNISVKTVNNHIVAALQELREKLDSIT